MSDEPNDRQHDMDREAVSARAELERSLDLWSARAVAQWWNRWYLKAGHKRLGRIPGGNRQQGGEEIKRLLRI
jgi:hypothetical protein